MITKINKLTKLNVFLIQALIVSSALCDNVKKYDDVEQLNEKYMEYIANDLKPISYLVKDEESPKKKSFLSEKEKEKLKEFTDKNKNMFNVTKEAFKGVAKSNMRG